MCTGGPASRTLILRATTNVRGSCPCCSSPTWSWPTPPPGLLLPTPEAARTPPRGACTSHHHTDASNTSCAPQLDLSPLRPSRHVQIELRNAKFQTHAPPKNVSKMSFTSNPPGPPKPEAPAPRFTPASPNWSYICIEASVQLKSSAETIVRGSRLSGVLSSGSLP